MPLPSSINDLSQTAGSNSPAGSESPSTIDDYLRVYASYIAFLRDSAQNGSLNYAAAGGSANSITATYSPVVTTLTDSTVLLFKAAANNTGQTTFSPNGLAAKPIVGPTHALLQGGEIIANGDVCLQYNSSIGGGSWVIIYSTGGTLTTLAAHGQCKLAIASATSIKLSPMNGQSLIIDGVVRAIPSGGVTLTNGGMNINTLYYIYAYMSFGVMTLEFSSTTGHATHTNGVEIKSGDSTRTFVGMVYANAAAQFSDGPTLRHVASYFNRSSISGGVTTTGAVAFTPTTPTNIGAALDISFLTFSDEMTDIQVYGVYTNGSATQSVTVQSYVDGAAWGSPSGTYIAVASTGFNFISGNSQNPSTGARLTEGRHTAQVYGSVTAGTGSTIQLVHNVKLRI